MTDRFIALTVVLEKDVREDDAQPLIHAISMLRGVLKVTPIITDNLQSSIGEVRAKHALKMKMMEILYD